MARAFQVTLDDRFAWCLAIDRLVYGQGKVRNDTISQSMPSVISIQNIVLRGLDTYTLSFNQHLLL